MVHWWGAGSLWGSGWAMTCRQSLVQTICKEFGEQHTQPLFIRTTTVHPFGRYTFPPPSNLATTSDDIPDKKRKGQKKTHTQIHTKFKRERKKHTHTHTLNTIRCTVGKEGRKEGRKGRKWVLPFTSLCQSEPTAHQCTMKDG